MLQDFIPKLKEPTPRLISRARRARGFVQYENHVRSAAGEICSLARESKSEFVRRMRDQIIEQASAYYDLLRKLHLIQGTDKHVRNERLFSLFQVGLSYENIQRTDPDAKCLTISGIRKAINEAAVRIGAERRPGYRGSKKVYL